MYPDFLTCGRCADEFPLSNINNFILHKTECLQSQTSPNQDLFGSNTAPNLLVLSCFICQKDFSTARGVLQHIQYIHHMDIIKRKALPVQGQEQGKPSAHPFTISGQVFAEAGVKVLSHADAAPATSVDTTSTPSAVDVAAAFAVDPATSGSGSVASVNDRGKASSPREVVMPATCAKLESTEGTTICCNGKECRVTINPPPRTPPLKTCCKSVIPKKRKRHMQEHDSEDIEQSALKTLANLHRRFLHNQKAKAGQRKAVHTGSRTSRSKSQCIMRCEREVVCVSKNSNKDSRCEGKKGPSGGDKSAEEEETADASSSDESSCEVERKKQLKKQKIDIYSMEKESITSTKTIVTNSGVKVTLQPTDCTTSKKTQTDQNPPPVSQTSPSISPDQNQNVLHLDASRESAQILAELMYHTSGIDQSAVQNVPPQPTDSQAALNCPAGAGMANPSTEPAFSSLNTSFYAANHGRSLNSLILNPSAHGSAELNAGIPVSDVTSQLTVTSPLDIQHLSDLDTLSPSIPSFPSLDEVSPQGCTLSMADFQMASVAQSQTHAGASVREGEGRMSGGAVKKRRYPTSRPYKCSECDQAFNQPIHLRKHMSKHTGIKPFKCERCDYSTVERSHLKAHNRIHTGEKPFQCQFCSYATAQNSTLKVHLKRHHHGKLLTV